MLKAAYKIKNTTHNGLKLSFSFYVKPERPGKAPEKIIVLASDIYLHPKTRLNWTYQFESLIGTSGPIDKLALLLLLFRRQREKEGWEL